MIIAAAISVVLLVIVVFCSSSASSNNIISCSHTTCSNGDISIQVMLFERLLKKKQETLFDSNLFDPVVTLSVVAILLVEMVILIAVRYFAVAQICHKIN